MSRRLRHDIGTRGIMLASMSANTKTPASPDGHRGRPFLPLLVHVVVGVLVMAGLFLTVHRRDVRSPAFESSWVKTGVFDQRWINLVETWKREGYWNHGGLWKLDGDQWFEASLKTTPWFSGTEYQPDRSHYYRSNSALFVVPLAVTDRFVGAVMPIRWTAVLVNQALVLVAAVLVGLLTARFAAICGADVVGALVLGLCAQCVYQTHPLNLASYFQFYMQHAFAIPCAGFLLALTYSQHGRGWARVSLAIATAAMVMADLPHAACTLVAWGAVQAILDRRQLAPGKSIWVLVPACLGAMVVGTQFLIASWNHPDAVWSGSALLFRTGLDGDTRYFGGALHGYVRLFSGPVLYGKGDAGREPIFWTVMLLAAPVVTALAIRWTRLRCTVIPLAAAYGGFILFAAAFCNAFAIHPYAYAVLLLLAGIPAVFGPVAGAIEGVSGRPRLVPLLSAGIAVVIVFSQLREFATQFPIAPDRTTLQAK